MEEQTTLSAEFNLYNTKIERLRSSGETDTGLFQGLREISTEYAKVLVRQLKKDNVIGKAS